MKAVILAGGKGTRLRPLTSELPKPMVPIMNVPVMEHIIRLLKSHGITEICVTLMFMPQKIQDYFQDGSRFGVHLEYFTEDYPLGTAGSIRVAEKFLTDTFLVISGDCMTDFDLHPAIAYHREKGATATIITTHADVPLDYGVVITNQNGQVTGFLEKPSWGEVFSDTINTGIYILEPSLISLIPLNESCDFSRDVFPQLLATPGEIYGYPCKGYWNDIGSLDAYIQTHIDVFQEKLKVQIPGETVVPGLFVGVNTYIDKTAIIHPPCFIGANCRIGPNVVVDDMSVIGDNTTVEEESSVKRCILWNGCHIDYGCELRGIVTGFRVHLMHHVLAFENCIIGDETLIRERAFIKPNVKIWPRKIVDSHAVVDRSVIWASRHSSALFGKDGLSGIINVDITPEFSSRLGSAYGTMMGLGASVIVSSDKSSPSRLFKYAFVSGLMSAGVKVYDINALFLPIARQAIPLLGIDGGIHIMQDQDSMERIIVSLMDKNGADAGRNTEKAIEALFFKEEFHRCHTSEITKVEEVNNFPDYYIRHLVNLTKKEALIAHAPHILISSSNADLLGLLERLFTAVGCTIETSVLMDRFSPYLLMQDMHVENVFMAAYLDANANQLILMDRTGRIVSERSLYLLTSLILFRSLPNFTLVTPVNQSDQLEEIAAKHKGHVIRTKIDRAFILKSLISHDAFTTGFNQYMLQFDAISALLRITEYLVHSNQTLESLLDEVPDVHTDSATLHCPWENIGRVMRRLITSCKPEETVLIDGVKIMTDGGWILVVPDAEQPMLHLYAEHSNPVEMQHLLRKYMALIDEIIDELD